MKRYSFILFILSLSSLLNGQSHLDNTVILYNVVPLRVDLNVDGTIKKIYGEDNSFLKGYKVVKRQDTNGTESSNYLNSLDNYVSLTVENYELIFDDKQSTLNENIIKGLDKSADFIFFNNKKMVVNSYKKQGTMNTTKLYKNRLNAILTYLEIKGVDKKDVIINLEELESSVEGFKIIFVQ
jgi:hypothetical protein